VPEHVPVESSHAVELGAAGASVAAAPAVNGLANGSSSGLGQGSMSQGTEGSGISLQPTIPASITSPPPADTILPDAPPHSSAFEASIPSETAASVAPQIDAPTSSAREEHDIPQVPLIAPEPGHSEQDSIERTQPVASTPDLMETAEDVQLPEPTKAQPLPPLTPKPNVAELSESNLEEVNAANAVPETFSAAPIESESMVVNPSLVDDPSTVPKAGFSVDSEMKDVPASPGKIPRPREEEEEDSGPAAKRTRTEDDGSAAPEFKIPDMPLPITTAPPGHDSVSAANGSRNEGKSITKAQNKFLLYAVRNVKRTKDAKWFNEPVDEVKLGLPTYYDVIKNPMDLRRVESKLKEEMYHNVDDVVSDVDLVAANARAFNGPDHAVTKAAESVKAAFRKSLPNVPKPDVVEPTPAEKKAKKLAPSGPHKDPGSRRPSRTAATAASPTGESSPRFALKEGVPIIRRDSIATDGRPKREIKPAQPRDLPYSASKPKKKKFQLELKFCQLVVDEMMKPKHAGYGSPFQYPVDPVALNIPTYHQIIKKPMDVSLVHKKLKDGEYEKASDFENDMRLIFANCYKFNVPGDVVYGMGKTYEKVLDNKLAGKAKWLEEHTPASAPQTPESVSEEEEDEEDEDSEDEAAAELEKLKRQIAAISENIEQINKVKAKKQKEKLAKAKAKKSSKKESKGQAHTGNAKGDKKRSKSGKKENKTPYVTYDMKQEISTSINNLPVDKMGHALTIIRENMPSLKVCGSVLRHEPVS
jgi:bromodomain-containing factor 1